MKIAENRWLLVLAQNSIIPQHTMLNLKKLKK